MNIPNKLLRRLDDSLYDLMHYRNHNYNGADWSSCGFCQNQASDIKGDPQPIIHAKDCLGVDLLVEFTRDEYIEDDKIKPVAS